MNIDNFTQLSFEQLNEIQAHIATAITHKKSQCLEEAVSDVLDLIASRYSEINLWELLGELVFHGQLQLDLAQAPAGDRPLACAWSAPALRIVPTVSAEAVQAIATNLKTIRDSVLQSDDARLLWLTNGGTQKTSQLFGRDLAEILQETIKKLERLWEEEGVAGAHGDFAEAVQAIDDWAELRLGIPLLSGTLTVINPFAWRQQTRPPFTETPRQSQRSPVPPASARAEVAHLTVPPGSSSRSTRHRRSAL